MIPYEKELTKIAKILRKNMTKQEKHLWYDFLSTYKHKFVRQKVIKKYIVDFYCNKAKLIIELDGSQHYSEYGLSYDKGRTEEIEKLGLKVLRYYNRDIDDNFEEVCLMIEKQIKSRIKHLEDK